MQSIAEAAMALPEICSLVIRKIDSPGGLARAARVNNAWHKEAIKSLWKGITTVDRLWDPDFKRWRTPNLDFLCGLGRAPARFRHYIQHVKYLDLWRRHPGTASNDAWILSQADLWTSLSCISLSLFRIRMSIDPWRTIAFLLKPSLRALELGDYMLSQPLMMDIKRHLPNLVWLSFDMEVAGVSQPDPGVVPGFLAQMHQLEGLVISDPPDSDIEIAVLRLPKLVVLHLHGDLEMTPAMLYSSSIMMSRLRELKLEYIEIAADSLRSFVSRLPSLEVFEFILNYPNGHGNLLSRFDVSDDILLPLTNSKRLQKLVLRDRLSGDREHSVSMSTLSRLCEACRQIESLHILFKRLTRTGLTSAIFHHFVQYLPRLEVLQLEYPMDVKTEDVTALAQGCPKLRTIGPYQVFNREVLKQLPAGVVFPHVENFIGRHMEPWHADWVGGRNPSIAAEILVFLDLLQQRLPRLRRLWVQRWFVDEAEKWCVDTRDVKVWGEDFRYGELVSHPFHGWPALELDRPSHELKLGVLGVD